MLLPAARTRMGTNIHGYGCTDIESTLGCKNICEYSCISVLLDVKFADESTGVLLPVPRTRMCTNIHGYEDPE